MGCVKIASLATYAFNAIMPLSRASTRGRYSRIEGVSLEQDEGTIVGQDNLKVYITNYYKQLFGPPEENFVSLDESRVEDAPDCSFL